jgi:hypothetical protein
MNTCTRIIGFNLSNFKSLRRKIQPTRQAPHANRRETLANQDAYDCITPPSPICHDRTAPVDSGNSTSFPAAPRPPDEHSSSHYPAPATRLLGLVCSDIAYITKIVKKENMNRRRRCELASRHKQSGYSTCTPLDADLEPPVAIVAIDQDTNRLRCVIERGGVPLCDQ